MARKVTDRPFPHLWEVDDVTSKSAFVQEILRETYGTIAQHFHRTRRYPWDEIVRFADGFRKGDVFVDMGCGNGRNAVFLAKRGMIVRGLDRSPELLQLAREFAGQENVAELCTFVEGDVKDMPFADATMGGGLYIAALHHLATQSERLASLAELERVLRDGGRGLISVWRRDLPRFESLLDVWEEHPLFERGDVMVPWKTGQNPHPRYYHLFTEDGLLSLLSRSSLRVEKVYRDDRNLFAVVRRT